MEFVSNSFDDDRSMPKETPSPSPVPHWEQPPDPPEITYNWVDITGKFMKACEGLDLGELVHEPNFGLFEAMSAIEMMDPKMDAGMIGKQTSRKVLSFQESMELNCIQLNNLDPSDLIIIMDACQACILSWLDGQSLAQTVFTCLYLHNPDVIEDRQLRAFCLGVLKLCDSIKDKIYKANVFEEEDFQTLTYGFKFAGNVTELRVIGMLKEVEDEVSRAIRNCKSKFRDHQNLESLNDELAQLQGVHARLKFLRLLLQIMISFGKKEVDVVQNSKKFVVQLAEQLKVIEKTKHFGTKPAVTLDDHEIVVGFEPLVNQRLLPPTFPRYTKLRSRDELASAYGDIVKRMLSIIEMTTLTTFQSVLEFMVTFAHSGPCVLTRSLAQITFIPENRRVFGSQLFTEVLKDSIRAFNCPPALSPRFPNLLNNAKAKECIDVFLTRASRTMMKLVQVYGHNYARQREKLASLLEDLAILQDDADRCDTDLHTLMQALDLGASANRSHLTSIGSWTLYHTLRAMIQYILSGFQLQLYSEHEFHYIYWYLAEVLLSWQITTLNRAENQLQRDEALAEQQQQSSKSRSNKKAKKNKKRPRLQNRELVLCQAMQMMAAGCFKVLLGFFMDGKMKSPDFVFDNEATRYEHRFAAFISVATPPLMPYKQFQEMTDVSQYYPPPTAQDLYLSSSKHFAQAKQMYETMIEPTSETQHLLRVAKTNLVVTKLLAGGHKQSSTTKPDFDFSAHTIFPIVRVT
ncbi:unnamed protein product [Clavelina lepadiformis]|uniref:N-alpha-acetyltransferase 35, NatC auxiliary subunit n=1 Tax=Clavelina lepadiformis TaxID=159417 RepID=A0ABP0FAI4_CLALP